MSQLAVTHPPADRQITKPRQTWLDYCRGIAIFLVVVYHVIPGMVNAGVAPSTFATMYGGQWAYAFHMPVFFFASGLFALRALRRGYREFLRSRLGAILYPYVVWTMIYWCCVMLMGRWTNIKPDPFEPFKILYQPYMSFWFLYTLVLVLLAFAGLVRLGLKPFGIFALSLIIYFAGRFMMLDPWHGFPAFWHGHTVWLAFHYFTDDFVYFAAGLWLRDWVFKLAQPVEDGGAKNSDALVVSLICFAAMSYFVYRKLPLDLENGWPSIGVSVVILVDAFLGIAGLVALCIPLGRWDALPFVRYWGFVSLEIYVLHELCTVPTRIVLQKVLHYNGFAIHLVLGTAAGLLIPVTVAWYCRRNGIRYVFAPGSLPATG